MVALFLVVLPVAFLTALMLPGARRVLGASLIGLAAGLVIEVLGALVLGRFFATRATAGLSEREFGTIVGFAHAMGGFLLGCYVGVGLAAVAAPVLGCRVFQSGSPRQTRPAAVGAVLGGLLGLAVAVAAGVAASQAHQSDLLFAVVGGGCAFVTLGAVVGWSRAPEVERAGGDAEARSMEVRSS